MLRSGSAYCWESMLPKSRIFRCAFWVAGAMNITMLNNKFRYKLTLKCRNDAAFRALLHETLDAYDAEKLPQKAS